MSYDEDTEDEEEEDEEFEEECSICQYTLDEEIDVGISFEEKESENDITICKGCLAQILKKAQVNLPQSVKVVEKIVEKPVEKIIYKTIDKNGNEIDGYRQETYRTKFD